MQQRLEHRLNLLRSEFEAGQTALAELETKKANLRDTLLRISGAIQVLEEELANAEASEDSDSIVQPELHHGLQELP
ncbi:MAG: hypothetical protein KME10_19705 [Plectolyngbya sp. WJT66-NPBG17]|nr:hypothetical protein [Plectolyngbya sp. WJT66-NPBG17]MBW4528280.1 hypothetical protein [Phormidium tanganyikae FI6-MK23]